MRRNPFGTVSIVVLIAALIAAAAPAVTVAAPAVSPFGFAIGEITYAETVKKLDSLGWTYSEFERRQFKLVPKDSPQHGQGTFLKAESKDTPGVRAIMMLFDEKQTLVSLIVFLNPSLFGVVMEELDTKYPQVNKVFSEESNSAHYDYVQWEKDGVVIELQRRSHPRVRLVYVSKLVYENYRDFLTKTWESFPARAVKEKWMDQL